MSPMRLKRLISLVQNLSQTHYYCIVHIMVVAESGLDRSSLESSSRRETK